jgi:hypothetical protein
MTRMNEKDAETIQAVQRIRSDKVAFVLACTKSLAVATKNG